MATVAPQTVYAYLVSQGVSPASATGILANIQAESGFNTAAIGDGGTSGGLFQHHAGRWDSLKAFANRQGASWTDWQVQVDFALQEARGMGINLQATDAADAAYEWTVVFERPANMEQKGRERASTVDQFNYGNLDLVAGGQAATDSSSQGGSINVPTDGEYFEVGGQTYVAFKAGYGDAQITMYFEASSVPGGKKVSKLSATDWKEQVARNGWISGGSTEAFRGAKGGQTFMQMLEPMLYEAGIMGSSALDDTSVWRVIGEFLARPDMSPNEFQNRLRQTNWWKDHTDRERAWNDFSPAEQKQQMTDMAGQLAGLYFTYVGKDVDISSINGIVGRYVSGAWDATHETNNARGDLAQWAWLVVSGQKTEQQFINEFLKPVARDTEGSPYWRILQDEKTAQGEHEVSVETAAAEIVDLYTQWGIRMDYNRAQGIAQKLVTNQTSMAEIENDLMEMASGLYPSKPKAISTMDWAQPYMQTYTQLMEVGDIGLFQRNIQNALQTGQTLADFRKTLKGTGKWLETKNAQEEFAGTASDLGRMMGFV